MSDEIKNVQLETITEIIGGLPKSSRYTDNKTGEPKSVVNLGDIAYGIVPPRKELSTWFIRQDFDDCGYRIRAGDIVVASRGFQFKIAKVTPQSEGAIVSSNLTIIRPKFTQKGEDTNAYSSVLGTLIFAYLSSPRGQYEIESLGQASSGRFSLKLKDLRRLEIPLPPERDQAALAEMIELAEKQYVDGLREITLARDIAHEIVRRRMNDVSSR